MQWRWWSANSCIPGADYACFKQELESNGFTASNWGLGNSCPGGGCSRCGCGEEFRNCIDISIAPNNGSTPVPTASPAPSQAPTRWGTPVPTASPAPSQAPTRWSTPVPTASPTPAQVPTRGSTPVPTSPLEPPTPAPPSTPEPTQQGANNYTNVCYFTNWARYRTGLINQGNDVFEMGGVQANM